MNDIEAAARAVINEWERILGPDPTGSLLYRELRDLRAALAHATRGEGEERPVHRDDEWWIRRINEAHKHGGLPWLVTVAKNFPRDEGASPTPPPATGMKCWRDVEGTLPARRDGDKVARVDPGTAIPATGKPWCRLCCGPHIWRDHVSTPYADEPPATGEAGTRGEVEIGAHAMDVAERCYYAIKGGALYRDSIRAMAAIIEAERPLPEAREGGRG